MVETYMGTCPKAWKRALMYIFVHYDCKKWIVGFEKGKEGYEHLQFRFETSTKNFMGVPAKTDKKGKIIQEEIKSIPFKCGVPMHLEKCTDNWEYETKEGRYVCSWDTTRLLKNRFGKPKGWQKEALEGLRKQNDRKVDVWYDPIGNRGKSWLTGHLFETREALIIPRDWSKGSEISNYVVHNYKHQRIIIIDIPRDHPIPDDFYMVVEMLKDGLVASTKWEGKMIHIDVAVGIFTNVMLNLKKLSQDRWSIHNVWAPAQES